MDNFTEAYIECALWASLDEDGAPFDESNAELAPQTLQDMENDCREFQTRAKVLLEDAYDCVAYSEARAGHDFWLTRCRHGAGYWDRGLGPVGDALTECAHAFGNRDLYRGDDNLIYQS